MMHIFKSHKSSIFMVLLLTLFLFPKPSLAIIEFSDFSFKKIDIKDRQDPATDKIQLQGSFSLGEGSDGINPQTDSITLIIGNFRETIPPGYFKKDVGAFLFMNKSTGLKFKFDKHGKLEIQAKKADLTQVGPLETVTLIIGDDGGAFDLINEVQIPISSGIVTGAVFTHSTNLPVSGADVTIKFIASNFEKSTTSDSNGLFTFNNVPTNGTFTLSALTSSGAIGTAQGSISETQPETSSIILVDQPGVGSLAGEIFTNSGNPAQNVLVTLQFPDSGRTASTITNLVGEYSFQQLHTDGTVIVISFNQVDASSASDATFITPSTPHQILDLTLSAPSTVQPDLTNGDFTNGLNGWEVTGHAEVVDREIFFSSQNTN